MAKTSYINEDDKENNNDPYASIESYIAYITSNPDPKFAKYKSTYFPSTQGTTGATEPHVGESTISVIGNNNNGSGAKEGDEKMIIDEYKYEGEDGSSEEIMQWLEQAKQWGVNNGFPGLSQEKDETK